MLRPVLALALACCALLGACGGGAVEARNAYVDAVNRARTAFDRDVETTTARLRETSTPARTRRVLGQLEDAATRFEGRLRAVSPPQVVAAEHGRLVAQVDGYGQQFARAQDLFRSEDPNAYLEARTTLQRDVASAGERLNAVIDELNRKLRQ